ncbi:MAG: hypothetical protein IPF70_08520 [Saprospiraceae bacterium]|nr:hypothetical protein [Saprospiraceae bacterium]
MSLIKCSELWGAHLFAGDFETMKLTMEQAGLINITQYEPGNASSAKLCLDDPVHAFETLYVEAVI